MVGLCLAVGFCGRVDILLFCLCLGFLVGVVVFSFFWFWFWLSVLVGLLLSCLYLMSVPPKWVFDLFFPLLLFMLVFFFIGSCLCCWGSMVGLLSGAVGGGVWSSGLSLSVVIVSSRLLLFGVLGVRHFTRFKSPFSSLSFALFVHVIPSGSIGFSGWFVSRLFVLFPPPWISILGITPSSCFLFSPRLLVDCLDISTASVINLLRAFCSIPIILIRKSGLNP